MASRNLLDLATPESKEKEVTEEKREVEVKNA